MSADGDRAIPSGGQPDVGGVSTDDALRARFSRDVSVVVGTPDAVQRPRDIQDIQDAVRRCAATHTPLLPVGARTSTTGASVPVGGGWVTDLSALNGEPVVDTDAGEISCPPGAVLAEVQALARRHGYDLPVDPTSAPDCTVGGAVATNASGPSSYRHGAMADWLVAVDLVDGRGERVELRAPRVPKRAMGPAAFQSSPRWFAGSEGTLGIATRVGFRLRAAPAGSLGALVGFPTRRDLLDAVAWLRQRRHAGAGRYVRAVEWLDAACCALIAPLAKGMRVPGGQGGALLVELETHDAGVDLVDAVSELLDGITPLNADVANTQLLLNPSDFQAFDHLRHHVPDSLNRRGRRLADDAGGGKLSTDWSAPVTALPDLLDWTDTRLAELGLDGLYMYGHIGDGHPHLNLLCPDADVRTRAFTALKEQLARVVAAGGVPVSEHGIGKLKRDLVRPWLPVGAVAAWRGLKQAFDPHGILAPGNVFRP